MVLFIQLIVIVALVLYFLITYWLPNRKYNPFKNPLKYEHMDFLDTVEHNGRILYLDLDNTLVYCTKIKPTHKNYVTIIVNNISDTKETTYYMIKRPYLNEFLREVC